MQELLNLLKEGKTKEALEGFKDLYAKTNDIVALYYLTVIEAHSDESDYHKLEKNFRYLYNYDKKTRISIIPFYIPFLLDIENYNTCLKVSKQAFKLKFQSSILNYAYAKSLIALYFNTKNYSIKLDEAIDHLYKSLEFAQRDNFEKEPIYYLLITALSEKKEYSKAYEIVNGLYITLSNPKFVDKLKLSIAFHENNIDLIKSLFNETPLTNENIELFLLIIDYYIDNDYFDETIDCVTKITPILEDKSVAAKNMAIAYLYKKDYDKGIEILKTGELKDEYLSNFLLGDAHYYKSTNSDLLKAIKYYEKAIEANPNEESKLLNCIADCYCELQKPFELMNIVSKLKKTNDILLIPFYMACYYKLTQHFDEAANMVKFLRKNKISESKISRIILDCDKKPEKIYPYVNFILYDNKETYALKECLKFKMLGEYGNTIDMKEAQKYAKLLETRDDLQACAYSILSNYYLIVKDYKKSYKYALQGYQLYLNDNDSCHCCAAYVAYHKLYGLGCDKDVKEAYKICLETEKKELGTINENLGHIYALCYLELGMDLNHIYELLIKTTYRRYSASRYNMIVKIGKLLNKDVSRYEKMFKESLKHCCVREKSHLSTNDFFMNNY